MSDRDDGLIFKRDSVKLAEYLEAWLADSVRDSVRRSTFVRYRGIVRNHIVPSLGHMKVKDLTPAHVRRLYRTKKDAGLSPRSVQYIHVILHKALKQAALDGVISRNVCDAVRPPQAHKKEITPLLPEQVRALLSAARGDRLEDLWQDYDLVFPNPVGKPLDHNNLYYREYKPLLRRAGLGDEGFTFHSLRHTFATELFNQRKRPKIIQALLGHSSGT